MIRALILEVKHKELTSLRRLYIDEGYLTQVSLIKYEDLTVRTHPDSDTSGDEAAEIT